MDAFKHCEHSLGEHRLQEHVTSTNSFKHDVEVDRQAIPWINTRKRVVWHGRELLATFSRPAALWGMV